MARFKVLVIAHSLKNNKVAKSGDIVDESQLTSPSFELVKEGFLEPIEEEIEPKIEEEEVKVLKPSKNNKIV